MKKTIPLLLAAILTFSLTACEETPIESSKITSQVTQEPQNGKDTLQNSDESESTFGHVPRFNDGFPVLWFDNECSRACGRTHG